LHSVNLVSITIQQPLRTHHDARTSPGNQASVELAVLVACLPRWRVDYLSGGLHRRRREERSDWQSPLTIYTGERRRD
jgi:hypothetical protein